MEVPANIAVAIYLVCVNVLAFALFGIDKSRAQRGAWRISEKTLMTVAVLGGSLGAFLGMRIFHHKTRKPLFSIGVPVLLVLTVVLVVALGLTGCQREQKVNTDFEEATVEYVIDGDTIDVVIDGQVKRVRLASIDAPESAMYEQELNTEEGALATEYVRGLLPVGTTVYLQKDKSETDKYDRLVRYVWLEVPEDASNADEVSTKMANALIVEAGYAQAERYWPDVAYVDLLAEAQERALAEGKGVSHLWA